MSYMFEVYYKAPPDVQRESRLAEQLSGLGGHLAYREHPDERSDSVCLTFEFDQLDVAEFAAQSLRSQGEHVEGPVDYGE